MVRNHFPRVVFRLIMLLLITSIHAMGMAQQSLQPKKQENKVSKSDSQKSYVPPRNRNATRSASATPSAKTTTRTVTSTSPAKKTTVIK